MMVVPMALFAALSHTGVAARSCMKRRVTWTEWPMPMASSSIGVSTIIVVSLN